MLDAKQTKHQVAKALYQKARQQEDSIITSNLGITELVALLTSPLDVPRTQVIAFINSLKASPNIKIVRIDGALDEQAWRLLANRADKTWSLVDCSSFVLMQNGSVAEALTTDAHFEQAGFRKLL